MTTTTTTAVNTTSSPLHYHFDTVEHDHILDMNSRLLLSSSNMNNATTSSSSSSSSFSSFSYIEKYYTTSFDHLTKSQQQANMITLRCSSILSIIGSSYIIYNLLGPRRKTELKQTNVCLVDYYYYVYQYLIYVQVVYYF